MESKEIKLIGGVISGEQSNSSINMPPVSSSNVLVGSLIL